jgi:putative peptidoglycan lipid II flippase
MKKLSFLTRVSLLLGFFFTLDKLLAFARTIIILRQFQLSSQLDAFYFADLLPSWEVAIFSGSALAMAMIPVLTQTLTLRFTHCSILDRARCQRGRTAFHCEPDAH